MVTVNLLPWRKYQAEYQSKTIKKMLITSVVVVLTFIAIANYFIKEKINKLTNEVQTLRQLKQKKSTRSKRISPDEFSFSPEWIEKLSQYNAATKILFVNLDAKPGFYFYKVVRNKNKIIFQGRSSSIFTFTEYIKAWRAARIFSSIVINQLQQKNSEFNFNFTAFQVVSFPFN